MATITTTTASPVAQYPANALIDMDPFTGELWAVVKNTSGNYEFWRSADGVTWGVVTGTITRANVQEWTGVWIADGRVVWAYRTNETSHDRIFVRYGNATSTAISWGAESQIMEWANGGVAGAAVTGMDLAVVILPYANIGFIGLALGAKLPNQSFIGCHLAGATVRLDTAIVSPDPSITTGTIAWYTEAGTARNNPSCGVEHDGINGKGSATPNLWISFGRTARYTVKLTWNGWGWNGPATANLDYSGFTAQSSVSGRWDGTRWIGCVPDASSTSKVRVLQRNRANTTLTQWTTANHPTGAIRNCAIAYDPATGNPRVFAVGTSTAVLYYTDYDRSNSTWGAWTIANATAILGANADNWNVRRDAYINSRIDVMTAHSGAPNTVTHNPMVIPYAPYTPTWNTSGQPYSNGTAADVAATLTLDWDFTDRDPLDVQSAYAISRQIGAGTISYFRQSDSTWQASEQKNASATTSRTLAASWGAGTDANHVYKVKVWDSTDLASGYSSALTIIPSVVVNPAITAPTAAQVITTSSVTLTWTATEQVAYRYILSRTSPTALTALDTGWVTSTTKSFVIPYTLANTTGWTITLQTRNNEGLPSAIQSRSFTVSYTVPATPTLINTPVPASGWISIAITNPAPSGGQPVVASQDLYRRVVGDTTDGIRVAAGLASGASYSDWKTASGVAYQYRSMVVGVNGAVAFSSWTT